MATTITEPVAPAPTQSKSGFSLISDHQLQQLYTTMLHCRRMAEKAKEAAGANRINGNHDADNNFSTIGQEAAVVGAIIDLQPQDTILPFREDRMARHVKGAPIKDLMSPARSHAHPPKQAWDEMAANIIPPSASVAAQLDLATAIALANKTKKNTNIVVAFLEQEAISVADFQPTLEFAAAQDLPIIFVWVHNLWLESEAQQTSTHLEEISVHAQACGIPAIPVDGNDVVAMYRVAYESIQRARNGGGPTVIEAHTHRPACESELDPISTMERYLTRRELFTPEWKRQLAENFDRQLSEALGATS